MRSHSKLSTDRLNLGNQGPIKQVLSKQATEIPSLNKLGYSKRNSNVRNQNKKNPAKLELIKLRTIKPSPNKVTQSKLVLSRAKQIRQTTNK